RRQTRGGRSGWRNGRQQTRPPPAEILPSTLPALTEGVVVDPLGFEALQGVLENPFQSHSAGPDPGSLIYAHAARGRKHDRFEDFDDDLRRPRHVRWDERPERQPP